MKVKVMTLVVCAFFLFSVVFASRPLSTDDAGTVEKGKTEIEVAYDFIQAVADEDNIHSAGLQIKHGITDNLDLAIAFPYSISPIRGTESVSLGIKLSFIKEEENKPGLSMTLFVEPGDAEYYLNGIFTKTFNDISLHINFGYESTGTSGESGTYTYSTACEYKISDSIGVAGEIIGSTEETFIHHTISTLIGLKFTLTDFIIIDAGAGINLSDENKPVHVTTGLTLSF
jgi:hypothetical protein